MRSSKFWFLDISNVDFAHSTHVTSHTSPHIFPHIFHRQGGQAIARKQVQGTIRGSKFWFLDISNLDFTHKEEFQHPAPLLHLTMFLRCGGVNG